MQHAPPCQLPSMLMRPGCGAGIAVPGAKSIDSSGPARCTAWITSRCQTCTVWQGGEDGLGVSCPGPPRLHTYVRCRAAGLHLLAPQSCSPKTLWEYTSA